MSTLVDRLVAGGLLAELAPISAQRAGRPAVPLVPAARSVVGVGLEVNVDYLGVSVMDLTGDIVDERVEPGSFHDSNPAEILPRVGKLARELIDVCVEDGMRVAGARLALPGLVDTRAGVLQVAPNLGWSSLEPIAPLGLDGLHVEVANEAKLAGLAELNGDVAPSFLYVSADVGIGAAIIVNRELFLGERGWNGEIGHVVVDPAGPRCGCGAFGCLEQYAGKDAVMRAAGLAADAPLETLVHALHTRDEAAEKAARRAALALGSALADFVNLVDVGTIVLGGAYTTLLPWLRQEVTDVLNDRVLSAPFAPVTVRGAAAGPYAAMAGGAREVLRGVLAAPADWV
ncbi:ROK family protein [Xylanimonas ulmi]|uniref:Putative NBD/HSP70 family sugar kinase n=1 Tax=Xylanimonas ulmi TaxID=228973 RepID=A0A4Q7M7A4_9MICO|nr:ROK family protein [Xylanibacterium ulmi]RZS61989.1 putative NBD/HSP70 family sugar kinase [Xylanibacterium ulmi]